MEYKIEGNNLRRSFSQEDPETVNRQIRSPAYSDILKVALSDGDVFKSRSDSISTYGGSLEIDTKTTRSIWKAITSFENFPVSRIESKKGSGGVVTLSPPLPGEIVDVNPEIGEMKVQSLAFLGVPQLFSVDLSTNDMYNNESLGTLDVENTSNDELNRIFIFGFHGIEKITLEEGERTHVREDYIAAIDKTIDFDREGKSQGFKKEAFQARDEAPSVLLTGPGKVYTHARSPFKFGRVIDSLEPY